MDVILSMANYKLMTSEFVKSESYYIILTDRNENALDHTACLDSKWLSHICWYHTLFYMHGKVLLRLYQGQVKISDPIWLRFSLLVNQWISCRF